MPKRSGRSGRGNKRGSRGGGNMGRIPRSTRGKKGPSNDQPMVMDDSSIYIPIDAKTSMRFGGRRPGRMGDAGYTRENVQATGGIPMRKRPVEFVKAKEVYDPSADLFKKISERASPESDGSTGSDIQGGEEMVDENDVEIDAKFQDVEEDRMGFQENYEIQDVEGDKEEVGGVSVGDDASDEEDDALDEEDDASDEDADDENSPTLEPREVKVPQRTKLSYQDKISAYFKPGEVPEEGPGEDPGEVSEEMSRKTPGKVSDNVSGVTPVESPVYLSVVITETIPEARQFETPYAFEPPVRQYPAASDSESTSESPSESELAFFIDKDGDHELNTHENKTVQLPSKTKPAPIPPSVLSRVIQPTVSYSEAAASRSVPNSALEYDDTLSVGKISMRTRIINDEVSVEIPSSRRKKSKMVLVRETQNNIQRYDEVSHESESDERYVAYRDYISKVMKSVGGSDYECEESDDSDVGVSLSNTDKMFNLSINDSEDEAFSEGSDNEPEFGFMAEDFEFDMSKVEITNIRQGVSDQYLVKSTLLLGTDDSHWIDEDMLLDFAVENGLVKYRLNAFLKYVRKDLLPNFEPEPTYSDIYISESSEEESDNENDLSALISFSKTQQMFFENIDIMPTKSIKTKGKNKKPDLDRIGDKDLRTTLQESYLIHKSSRKDKKKERESAKLKASIKAHDLSVKYPHMIHITDIKEEFEAFLQDQSRNALTFPPLDSHGNKTLGKLAHNYNMKHRALGEGLKRHIVVVKNKRTFHSLPDYGSIGYIIKQRPIYHRVDVKRLKEEVLKEDKKKLAPSKANVNEGDIVGAHAPAIGKENIGRRLLEKLGWIHGEGLGALGNQGINEPVMAVVKKTKTGLK